MYDFHKIKNRQGHHEFQHEKFRRGRVEDLKLIKRKINDTPDTLDSYKNDSKALLIEYNRLKRGHNELEESLRTIASQNKKLVEANKDLVYQMYYFKSENELRTRKLLFLFFILMNNYTPELLNVVKHALEKINLVTEADGPVTGPSFKNIGQFIKRISHRLIFQSEQNNMCLDTLMNIFTNYLKTHDQETSPVRLNWDELLQSAERADDFDNLLQENTQQVPQIDGNREVNFIRSPLKNDKFSEMEKDSNFDKDSILDLKSENFNDFEFIGNLSRRISSLRSIGENFFDNEPSAVHPKSPQSQNSNSAKFH